MNDMHYCLKEKEWGELKATLDNINDKLLNHVIEGDKPGGYRDRLLILEKTFENAKHNVEKEISTIKKGYWLSGLLGGLIGALIGNATPELIDLLLKLFK